MALDYIDNNEAVTKNNAVVRGIFSSSWNDNDNNNKVSSSCHKQQQHNTLEEILPPSIQNIISFEEGLDFILTHFEEPIWPRTIFTHSIGRQVLVYHKKQALARFRESNFLNCRINAYPDYTGYRGINRQPPNFLFLDLDQSIFKTERTFNLALKKTLNKLGDILDAKSPTVLWSGNGYHIYQPVKAFPLEQEELFISKSNEPSKEFLQFAEQHLTNYRSDPSHHPSIKSCLIRIPGSHNFKCVQKNNGIADSTTEVKIIQKWDGIRPKFNSLLYDFNIWLAGEKIKDLRKLPKTSNKKTKKYNNKCSSIEWIERLLQTPISDHRKFASHWILSRYLVNVKHTNANEAYALLKDWSMRCNESKCLSPSVIEFDKRIKYDIKEAINNGKAPIGKNLLEKMNPDFHTVVIVMN